MLWALDRRCDLYENPYKTPCSPDMAEENAGEAMLTICGRHMLVDRIERYKEHDCAVECPLMPHSCDSDADHPEDMCHAWDEVERVLNGPPTCKP